MATINKPALVEEISLYDVFENASKKDITLFVEAFFDLIAGKVVQGDEVSIPGFGKFSKFQKQDGTFKPKFAAFKEFRQNVQPS